MIDGVLILLATNWSFTLQLTPTRSSLICIIINVRTNDAVVVKIVVQAIVSVLPHGLVISQPLVIVAGGILARATQSTAGTVERRS
jgi:hypothetical protein